MITWTWFGWWRSWISKLRGKAVPAKPASGVFNYYLLHSSGLRLELGCTPTLSAEQAELYRQRSEDEWLFGCDPPEPQLNGKSITFIGPILPYPFK